ncbi:MAG: hypothetical protein JSS98_08575 [Bacteroidetes bacterium]|nr:hypothetical protein [Bacteroidota bacterium]
MKKQLALLTAVFLIFSLTIQAQDKKEISGKKFKVGLGLEGALPVGVMGDAYSVGAGLSLRFLYKITPQFGATFTTGGIAFIPKDLNNLNSDSKATLNIPVKLGGRYKFTDKFYGIMEAGVTHSIIYYEDANGNLAHLTGNSFTYAPGIGVLLGGFDASLRYEGYENAGFIGLRLGFFF